MAFYYNILCFYFIAASTTVHLFMESSTALLTTNSSLKEQEIMMKDLDTSNIKTAGFRKITSQRSQMLRPK